MAKDKEKQASGTDNNVPDGGAPLNSESNNISDADALPKLDEGAFAGLRQKIEQKLKNENESKQRKSNKHNGNSGKKSKKESENDATKKQKEINAPKSESGPKQDLHNKGRKRDSNGDVIGEKDKAHEKKDRPQSKSDNGDGDDTLRREILALGGTQEDFDLLANVESESETEAAAGANSSAKSSKNSTGEKSLRDELTKILDAAGHVVPSDIEDGDEDAESERDGKEEKDNEVESISEAQNSDLEEEVPEPAPKAVKEPTQKERAAKEPIQKKAETILPKEYSKLTITPRPDWYSIELPPVSSSSSSKNANALPRYLVDRVHQHAITLLETENKMYSEAQRASNSSSQKFYSTIMSSGTLSDKISALTLAVQESPLHNTKSLETLVGLARKRSRAQAVEVLRSLKDMLAHGTILPSDRRLRSFANQPSLVTAFQGASSKWTERDPLPGGLQKSHLILWAFEHYVKDQYFEVLKILEVWCNDEIEFSRSRAVSYVYELLKEKPEQEANLLRLLVNKLGDRGKKIASRASYFVLQLEQAHPLMKQTIISAIEELLFRPGQSQHAKYYAIITLNQTVLSLKEDNIAAKLLDIYFSLFVILLKPARGKDGKNKVQPAVANRRNGNFDKKNNNSHKNDKNDKNFAARGQTPDEEMRDKLTSGVLTGVNRAYPFTNSDSESLSKHIDTLFRITHSSNFNTSIQALMLIQQLTSSHKVSSDRFYRTLYESLLDSRIATSSKQSLYLNLLYKSLKNDLNVNRVKAFVKRIVQILGLHQPSFICGIFYLIRELEKTFPGLRSLFDQPPRENKSDDDDDDDEEVFRDVPDEDDDERKGGQGQDVPENKPQQKQVDRYDPRKRDPEHSNADKTCLWELLPYLSHFHPSVSLNASYVLQNEPMSGKPDLTLHTLTHFLDRFVYRSPKTSAPVRGVSIMQPLAGGDTKDRLLANEKDGQYVPVNSDAFWKKKAEEVAAEDVFFHEYFNRVGKGTTAAQKTSGKGGKDGDEEDDDEESAIWKALVKSRPELEGDEGSDDDLDMSDLESAYDKEEDEDGDGDGDEDVIFNDESDEDEEDEEEFTGVDSDTGAEGAEKQENAETDQPAQTKSKSKSKSKPEGNLADNEEGRGEEEEEAFDMDVSDDEAAFIDSDEEVPMDMIDTMDLDMDAEPEEGKEDSKGKGKGKSGNEGDGEGKGQKKKRKLKHLPTFASVDDYAALLEGEDEGR